jgi:hypothetical protein
MLAARAASQSYVDQELCWPIVDALHRPEANSILSVPNGGSHERSRASGELGCNTVAAERRHCRDDVSAFHTPVVDRARAPIASLTALTDQFLQGRPPTSV